MIFISNANEDKDAASRLYRDLKKAGFNLWMADQDLLGGQNRDLEIRNAVRKCAAFLALISKSSVAGRGVFHREMKLALTEYGDFPEGSVFLIPISLDGTKPAYEQMRNLEPVDMSQSYENGFQRILKALKPEMCLKSQTAVPKFSENDAETDSSGCQKKKPGIKISDYKKQYSKILMKIFGSKSGDDRLAILDFCSVKNRLLGLNPHAAPDIFCMSLWNAFIADESLFVEFFSQYLESVFSTFQCIGDTDAELIRYCLQNMGI